MPRTNVKSDSWLATGLRNSQSRFARNAPARLSSLAASVFLLLLAPVAVAQNSYSLQQLTTLAREQHPLLGAMREQVNSAAANIQTARTYANPEIEVLSGSQRARAPGGTEGGVRTVSLTQRLDLPQQRDARIGVASAGLMVQQASLRVTEKELVRSIKLHFYELLRRLAELDAAEQDLQTSNDIRDRVSVRVRSGEAPRYDVIKADAELLIAQKQVQSAKLRLLQAKANLRNSVGASLPAKFEVQYESLALPQLPPLETLQTEAISSSPDLMRGRSGTERAREQLRFERSLRLPSLALRAGFDQDPDVRSSRIGVIVSIPIWDRRIGPSADAAAQLVRAQLEQQQHEFSLRQALETAYQQYEISRTQLAALESGIIKQSEAALRIAEAAYRFGERGILDYLDAQRVYRSARNELIAVRYEARAALIEIERLHRESLP